MLRRLVGLGVLLGCLTACGSTGAEEADAYWLTAPATDAARPGITRC